MPLQHVLVLFVQVTGRLVCCQACSLGSCRSKQQRLLLARLPRYAPLLTPTPPSPPHVPRAPSCLPFSPPQQVCVRYISPAAMDDLNLMTALKSCVLKSKSVLHSNNVITTSTNTSLAACLLSFTVAIPRSITHIIVSAGAVAP